MSQLEFVAITEQVKKAKSMGEIYLILKKYTHKAKR